MKNNLLATVVVILAIATLQTVHAQNIVAFSPQISSKQSIVREYSKQLFVVYNHAGGNVQSFNLINFSTGTCRQMPTPNLDVNDMEVVGGMAYFCGKWNGIPVAGWFDISNLFSGSGDINYINMPSPLTCPYFTAPITNETILSLDRLDVVDFGSSYSHLVMIGSAQCAGVATPTQCIVEVYNNGANWNIAYQVEHYDIFHYDDIAITSNRVIVVGHKKYTDGEYITSFINPTINNHMFSIIQPPTYGSSIPAYLPHPDSEVLIDNIPGTTFFATVCQAREYIAPNVYSEGTYLNIYSNYNNVVYRCRIGDYHPLSYKELKYNAARNSFFLLMEDCATNLHNGYYEFTLNNTFTNVTSVLFHKDNTMQEYFSIDKYTKEQAKKQSVLTGCTSQNYFVIWNHDVAAEQDCSKTYNVQMSSIATDIMSISYDYYFNTASVPLSIYRTALNQSMLSTICIDR